MTRIEICLKVNFKKMVSDRDALNHIVCHVALLCSLPTDIQAEVVPLILGGGDVMAAAETGSGKTGAFCLPIVQIVHERLRLAEQGSDREHKRQATEKGGGQSGTGEERCAGSEPCTLNLQDRSSIVAVSDDGLVCQARSDREWGGCRATGCIRQGKTFFEITVEDEGLCRVGWALRDASLDIGTDQMSFGFGGTGKKSHGRKFEDYGEAFGLHDVIGCWIDRDAGAIGFVKNGKDLGKAYDIPPKMKDQGLYPAVCLKNAQVAFNFRESVFPLCVPEDFKQFAQVGELVQQGAVKDEQLKLPLALILEPVRDLAEQTKDVLSNFALHLRNPSVQVSLVIGGESAASQVKEIKSGAAIIVGTPGRVQDLVKRGELDVSGVKYFVLDEADALLEAGHRDMILSIFRRLSGTGTGIDRLQTLLFSATLHSPTVTRLSNEICQNPMVVDLKGANALPDAVDHALVMVDPTEDRTWLQSMPKVWTDKIHDVDPPLAPDSSGDDAWSCAVKILKPRLLHRLVDSHNVDQALVFCRTNFDCENLERFLNQLDQSSSSSPEKMLTGDKRKRRSMYSCAVLAGARSMDERRAALDSFKEGHVRFLIATDVAARGIDISGLPYVINMTLPDKREDYVHRSGRVGRAETPGLCISLVSSVPEKVWFCKKKGLKPWLKPTKENTSASKKGHAIWMNEKTILGEIEDRLGAGIVSLLPDMSLPESLEGSRYGKKTKKMATEDETIAKEVAQRVEASRESVKRLAQLEHEAQRSFFLMKTMWNR